MQRHERGRLTKATYPEIGDVDYFYDATGLKTKVTDALDHSTEYFFDYTRHVLTRTLDAVGKELRYFYDGANRVTKTGAGSTAAGLARTGDAVWRKFHRALEHGTQNWNATPNMRACPEGRRPRAREVFALSRVTPGGIYPRLGAFAAYAGHGVLDLPRTASGRGTCARVRPLASRSSGVCIGVYGGRGTGGTPILHWHRKRISGIPARGNGRAGLQGPVCPF